MITKVININSKNFDSAITEAADIIQKGGIVAFPTETVYGLGANALNESAVSRIFAAKGRPQDNPLIVHVASISEALSLTEDIPAYALELARLLWPGPLTLVLKKSDAVPSLVTAGLPSIAVRMPAHRVALALILAAGVPIAAPSANVSGRPSPTRASHVLRDFDGKIPLILDGGPCRVGLESTVVDCTTDKPVILRPGGVTVEMIKEIAGDVELHPAAMTDYEGTTPSPGMKHKHYAPRAKLFLVYGEKAPGRIVSLYDMCESRGGIAAIMGTKENALFYGDRRCIVIGSRRDLGECARNFFSTLRALDDMNVDEIFAESFSRIGIGLALMDRALRAASFQTIDADRE